MNAKSEAFKCVKCGSTDLYVTSNSGGCDSCSYGASVEIQCNKCHTSAEYS